MSEEVCHVTWDEILRVLTFCERVRNMLGLGDWAVGVSVDPADDDCHAAIDSHIGKRMANLYLPKSWMDKPERIKRRTLLHEMLHLAHQRQAHAVDALVLDQSDLSKDRSEAIMGTYWRESEYMVDSLATSLAVVPGLLPAWPTLAQARRSGHTNEEP